MIESIILEASSLKKLSFKLNGTYVEIFGTYREIARKVADYCYNNGLKFSNTFSEREILDKIKSTSFTKSSFHKLPSGQYIGGLDHANGTSILRISKNWLSSIGELTDLDISDDVRIKKFGEIEDKSDPTISEEYVENPFMQSVCILGKSGAGKSYRIERTLEEEEHNYELIIPTAATTNLLVQYSKGSYVLSRLGKIILDANSNPSEYYTVVFDECHKYIDMINDELLQCISTRRNNGLRFISLDPSTDELFQDLEENRGRRVIPDNLGFIFISSKEEIIRNNSDFYNRVDIVTIDREDRDIEFAVEVLKDKIEEREDEEYSNE